MKRGRGKRALILLALALGACQSPQLRLPPTPQTTILELRSTESTAPLLRTLVSGYQAARPTLRLALQLSTISAMEALTAAGAKAPLTLTEFLPASSSLWAAPIGDDLLAVITHPANAIGALSVEQLRAIYTGRLSSWRDVGGEEAPITVVSREAGSATRAAFEALVMAGSPSTSNARLAPGTQAMLEIVAGTPGAIGYVPLHSLTPDVRPLALEGVLPALATADAYPLRIPLLLIAAAEPEGLARDFVAWAQGADGQRIIARYAVPLH
ncbi:MAG: hypothetical protein HPY64_07795 [Anaerolineae bacterium]|nr:hypothetical protein [Anaerolineae bacterium]